MSGMGNMRNTCSTFSVKEGKYHLENPVIDGKIILRLVLGCTNVNLTELCDI
jgi:hypothetical protein